MAHMPLQPTDGAPPLRLPDLDGRLHDLADLRGRPVLVSFLRHTG